MLLQTLLLEMGYPNSGIIQNAITGNETLTTTFGENATLIDSIIFNDYGTRFIFPVFFYDETRVQLVNDCVKTVLLANNYKFKTLFASTKIEYNPVENYNMKEEETENRITLRDETDTATSTQENGSVKITDTKSVSPFDSSSFTDAEKNISNTDAITDKNNAENVHTADNSEDVTRTLTRSGNIGVTTTQQMIESERNIANINVCKDVAQMIANAISSAIYYSI